MRVTISNMNNHQMDIDITTAKIDESVTIASIEELYFYIYGGTDVKLYKVGDELFITELRNPETDLDKIHISNSMTDAINSLQEILRPFLGGVKEIENEEHKEADEKQIQEIIKKYNMKIK